MDARGLLWNMGLVGEKPLVCQYILKPSTLKHGPFQNTTSMFLVYLILIFFVTRTTHAILKLLHQNMLIAQIIAGIIIGPSFLTQNDLIYYKLFPPIGTLLLQTIGSFGVIIHLFGLGVNANTSVIKKVNKKFIIIGLTSYFSGFTASFLTLHLIQKIHPIFFTQNPSLGIIILISMNSNSPFIVMSSLLLELKMINSQLGKLVSKISIICDICGWSIAGIMGILKSINNNNNKSQNNEQCPIVLLTIFLYYSTMFFVCRPLVIHIASKTPEGKPMTEGNFFMIITLVLGIALAGDVIGQSASLAAFIFGLALPDGPPLGMTLIDKFDTICTGILLPVFFTVSGGRTWLQSLNKQSIYFGLIVIMGYLGKFLGTLLSCVLVGKVSVNTAVAVALVLCCKGVLDISAYGMFKDGKLLTNEGFCIAVLAMITVTGISIPVVKFMYNPSSTYLSGRRQTIVNSGFQGVIRVLICIYKEDNVAPMIQLLQVAKPRKDNPLSVLVLQLFELIGSKQAVLAPYNPHDSNPSPIVAAFRRLEKEAHENLRTQHFNSVAPYATMHDDICSLAYDRGVNLIILPFHQNIGFDKTVPAGSSHIRNVNRRVMRNAPCSVGILIDKKSVSFQTFSNVVVLFLGGMDDHETLAYSKRLVEDSSVSLTVMRIKSSSSSSSCSNTNNEEEEESYSEEVDEYVINDFLACTRSKPNVKFKTMNVDDGVGTIQIIRSLEEEVDLVLVGRFHDSKMSAISGLMDWSNWPELGAIGAMLTTWDFQFSVLVIQQQQLQQQQNQQQQRNQKRSITSWSRQNSSNSYVSVNEDTSSVGSMSCKDDYFTVSDGKPFQYFKFSET